MTHMLRSVVDCCDLALVPKGRMLEDDRQVTHKGRRVQRTGYDNEIYLKERINKSCEQAQVELHLLGWVRKTDQKVECW